MTAKKATPAKAKPKSKPRARKAPDLTIPEDLSIPRFLLTKHRVPPTPEQKAEWEARLKAHGVAAVTAPSASDSRRPKGISDADWVKFQTEREEARKAKSYAQLGRMHARRAEREAAAAEKREQRAALTDAGPQALRKPPQEGSRKRKVYDALMKSGQAVALKLGAKLELKEGTVRSWFGAWARQAASEQATAPTPKSGKRKALAKNEQVVDRHPRTDGKRRVYLVDVGPWAQGTVAEEGDQPIVHWDNGNVSVVLPEWVADLSNN